MERMFINFTYLSIRDNIMRGYINFREWINNGEITVKMGN